MRCGWFVNPSPNNASLLDRDGEWLIAMQGQFEAKGEWPAFRPSQWVGTGDASYGYGCACMMVEVDDGAHRILRIRSAQAKPLSTCRHDKKLSEPRE